MDGQEAIPGLNERGLGRLLDQIPDHFDNVGPGWRGILERAHRACLAANPSYTVAQVKEKFGGLRLYLDGVGHAVTGSFEEESYTTCEKCGSREAGPQKIHGWIHTYCGVHAAERKQWYIDSGFAEALDED